jgi:hypothetical protein
VSLTQAASRLRLAHTRHQLPRALAQAAGASVSPPPPAYDAMDTLAEAPRDEQAEDAPVVPTVDAKDHEGADNAAFVPDNSNHM